MAGKGLLQLDEWVIDRHEPPVDRGLDPAMLPWAAAVQASWTDLRAELDQLLADDVKLPVTDDLIGVEQGADGRWTTYVLCWFGEWLEFNAARCPKTTALVRDVPGVEIAGFTVMHAGTHIPAHRGPTKALRYQVGVVVPDPPGSCRLRVGDEVIEHAEGKALLFDDRTEHEAWNDSDADRYVFFVQVRWPLPPGAAQVHQLAHWAFGQTTRGIPKRAAELDTALNGRI
jgi:aspartyl/asparaginyl beta-hydroxylase (cupin superfamily)